MVMSLMPPAPSVDLDAAGLLRGVGLRVTAPRLAVLAAVADHPHAGVDTLAAAVRARIGSVSTQAVYDVARVLTETGLLRRIEPAGSPALFELGTDDNHHHVVCRECGSINDVACLHGSASCLTPATDNGYLIDEAEVTFWGVCPQCRSARQDA